MLSGSEVFYCRPNYHVAMSFVGSNVYRNNRFRFVARKNCVFVLVRNLPVRAPGRNAPSIRFVISALYMLTTCPFLFKFSLLFSLLCFPSCPFSSLFPYLSPPLLIFSFDRSAPFPGRMSYKRRLNLALVFLCLFCVVVHFFWLVNWFSFFHTKPRDWAGETSPKWPTLCPVGRKTTTQPIN